jgi:hypothetical protein
MHDHKFVPHVLLVVYNTRTAITTVAPAMKGIMMTFLVIFWCKSSVEAWNL